MKLRHALIKKMQTLLMLGGALAISTAWAQGDIVIESLTTEKQDQSIQVNCEITYRLDEKVKQALSNGIMMTFVTDLELLERTSGWFDQVKASYHTEFTIKYHALSKQFVLSMNNLERSYPDLFSVFYRQTQLCDFRMGPIDHIQLDDSTYLRVRNRLSTEDLPLPLRIKSYLSSDWRPTSGWTIWTL